MYWPIYFIIASLSIIFVWMKSPEWGEQLTPESRQRIGQYCQVVHKLGGDVQNGRIDQIVSRNVLDNIENELDGFEASLKKAFASLNNDKPQELEIIDLPSENGNSGEHKNALKNTDSPYLVPAANALSKYKKAFADYQAEKENMSFDDQAAAKQKLTLLVDEVRRLNAQHRTWKQEHGIR